MTSTKMLSLTKLKALKQAAERGDWSAAGDAYLDLSEATASERDRFAVQSLAPEIRLRDSERIVDLVDQLLASVSTQ